MGRHIPDAAFETMPLTGDSWTLVAEGDSLRAGQLPAVFALGNGFVGVRGPGGAPGAARVYLNGVFEKVGISYHEAAHGYARESDMRLPVADATLLDIDVDGQDACAPVRIALDLRQGILTETYQVAGVVVEVERLVSMGRRGIAAARIRFRSPGAQTVSVRPRILPPPHGVGPAEGDGPYDPRLGPEIGASPWIESGIVDRLDLTGRVDTLRGSGFAVAALAGPCGEPLQCDDGSIEFETVAAYAAVRGPENPLATAEADLLAARSAGFAALAAEQADWFGSYWRDCGIAMPDAPLAEQALRHGLFQLVQAAGRDGTTSIAAKGQTGEGYEGHVFWDADLYVLPVFALTRPEIARSMLAWRISCLGAARANARDMGHPRGALYPWRTIEGRECSSFFPAGSAQYHINADIAFAARLYVDATGDSSLLAEGGAEMIVETARIWLEIGFHDPARGDAFVINSVTGPDEYSALVDNNLYTNMMAAEHLRLAVSVGEAAGLLDREEAARMQRAADAMCLPFDAGRGIYAQDERFFSRNPWPFASSQYPLLLHYHPLLIYRHQVAKQADAVLATALLRDAFAPEMRKRMLDAYEAVTVHDSTLSASVFATVAANVGDADKAFDYWRVALLTDLSDLFANSAHGLHMAALAGGWTAMAMGFAGLRTTGGRLSFEPIAVARLGRYRFRIRFRQRSIDIDVDGLCATYTLVEGDALAFDHLGQQYRLEPGRPVVGRIGR